MLLMEFEISKLFLFYINIFNKRIKEKCVVNAGINSKCKCTGKY